MAEVVGLGEARVEHFVLVERFPEPESMLDMSGFSIQGGGTAATALATLARLGVQTKLLAKVGADDFGRFVLNGLSSMTIDSSGVVVEPDRISPCNLILMERDGRRRRSIIRSTGTVSRLSANEVSLAALDDCKLLILDGYHPRAELKLAQQARHRGLFVVLDASGPTGASREIVPLADVLIATERFVAEVAPHRELEESMQAIARLGPSTVVVTMGREGSIALQGDKLVRQPALQVEAIDPTGAGDVFLGAYCYGLIRGHSLEQCMHGASTAAGLSCRGIGSRSTLPSLEEIDAAG